MDDFAIILARGKVIGHKRATFEGKSSFAVQLQRLNSKDAVEMLNIKMPDGVSVEEYATRYPRGSEIEFAIDAVAVESSLYFRFVRDLKVDAPAPENRRPRTTDSKPVTA